MIPLDDETLMAYADGQLETARLAEVEAALATNPGAMETVQFFKDTRCLMCGLYDAPLRQPVPARLLNTLTGDDRVVPIRGPRTSWSRSTVVPWSLAATVAACAVGLGSGIFSNVDPLALFDRADRPELVDNLLGQALENRPSGSPLVVRGNGIAREIVPLLTFQDTEGRYCREFENQLIHAFGKNTVTVGMACREGEGWQIQAIMNRELLTQDTSSPGYQPASGESGISPYDAIMDRVMQSLPVTPTEEAQIIEREWSKINN